MALEDVRTEYLATGSGEAPGDKEQLDLIRGVLARGETWEEPPATVIEGLLATIGREGSPVVPARRQPGRSPRVWVAAAVAVVVAGLAIGASALFAQPVRETVVAMTGTDLAPGAHGEAVIRPADSGWYIRLDVDGLPPAPEGTYYEGWVWGDTGHGVSIGTFHLRGDGDPVVLWSGVGMDEYPSIWVTLQDEQEGPSASDLIMMTGRVGEEG